MVAPSVPCTLITPVAPHSLSFRCGRLSSPAEALAHLQCRQWLRWWQLHTTGWLSADAWSNVGT